jgi:hypothetical protein
VDLKAAPAKIGSKRLTLANLILFLEILEEPLSVTLGLITIKIANQCNPRRPYDGKGN